MCSLLLTVARGRETPTVARSSPPARALLLLPGTSREIGGVEPEISEREDGGCELGMVRDEERDTPTHKQQQSVSDNDALPPATKL